MFVIFIIVLLIVVLSVAYNRQQRTRIRGTYRSWEVAKNYKNSQLAAASLEQLNARVIRLFEHLQNKYILNDDRSPERYYIVSELLDNYNPDKIFENDPRVSLQTSYTLDKEAIYVCMRDRERPEQLENMNDLMFVYLHELAHIAYQTGIGHGREFWQMFRFILIESVECGIIKPVNYALHPITYCGLYVDYNPYYDTALDK